MTFDSINLVALTVGVLGAGGIGAFLREIVSVIGLVRTGVSAKESTRKNDLVTQRDREYARAERERERAEAEARNRRRLEEYSSRLRRTLVEKGLDEVIDPWPALEDTMSRAELNELKKPKE